MPPKSDENILVQSKLLFPHLILWYFGDLTAEMDSLADVTRDLTYRSRGRPLLEVVIVRTSAAFQIEKKSFV